MAAIIFINNQETKLTYHLTDNFCRLPSIGAPRLRAAPNDSFSQTNIELLGSFDTMTRVYIGNLDPRVTERELEDEFRMFGVLRSVWVARRPPGYAFIEFDDRRDALDAIQALDGKNGWRVELSHNSKGSGGGGGRRGRGGGGGG
ncbi:Serine/arginine-rich splicing factor RSZ21, partial [Cucurbita argyrosperma subsp. argyrosperma]